MKIYKLFLTVFLAILPVFLYAQDDEAPPVIKQLITTMAKMAQLQREGKFAENIPLMVKMEEALRKEAGKNNDVKEHYIIWLISEAKIYEVTGYYTRAELQLRKAIAENAAAKDKNIAKSALNLLAEVYEKMGNKQAALETLEELVVTEYAEISTNDEKAAFVSLYYGVYKNMVKTTQDSLNIVKMLEESWEKISKSTSTDNADNDGENTAEAQQATIAMMQMIKANAREQTVTQPVQLVPLLRQGKLNLTGVRNGNNITEPWAEVQKLFKLYIGLKNYTPAEALIKHAIAIDENNTNTSVMGMGPVMDMVMGAMADKDAFALLYQHIGVGVNQAQISMMAENMKYISGLSARYMGKDVFNLQNKVLLAGLFKETGREAEYRKTIDTVYIVAKKLGETNNPMLLNLLGNICLQIEKYDDAIAYHNKIKRFFEGTEKGADVHSIQYIESLQQLAQIYQLKNDKINAEAILKLLLAFDTEKGLKNYPVHLDNLSAMARFYAGNNKFNNAEYYCSQLAGPSLRNLTDNFSFLSEHEKLSFLNNQLSNFNLSLSLLQTNTTHINGFATSVYNQQLILKGLVLNEQKKMLNRIRQSATPALSKAFTEWQNNKSAIAWHYTQAVTPGTTALIDSLTRVSNAQEKRLNQISSAYVSVNKEKDIDFKIIREKLKPGEATIEFVRFEQYQLKWTKKAMYAAFIVLPADTVPHFIPLCTEESLESILTTGEGSAKKIIDLLYGNGIDPDKNTIQGRKSDMLFKLVWQPLLAKLQGVNKVFISPAGLLCRINFAALPFNDKQYLLDKYQIRQFNTIRQIAETQQVTMGNNAVLFGDIDYGKAINNIKSWVHLSTLNETTTISNFFIAKKRPVQMITAANATVESLYKLSGKSPSVLYIATHGFFDIGSGISEGTKKDNPMFRSGIIMANANNALNLGASPESKYYGKVTAYEIADLDLSSTSLVTLTACETALGDIGNTEGVFGLQRAFKLAGVNNMLLGLWNLPLLGTNKFITTFYQNYVSDNMAIYDAFSQTQKKFRATSSPYNWAGMVLIE